MEASQSIHNLLNWSIFEIAWNEVYGPPITATVSTVAPTGAVLDVTLFDAVA